MTTYGSERERCWVTGVPDCPVLQASRCSRGPANPIQSRNSELVNGDPKGRSFFPFKPEIADLPEAELGAAEHSGQCWSHDTQPCRDACLT